METDGNKATSTRAAFGANMRKMRQELGMTQLEIAEGLRAYGIHLAQTQVAKVERGERPTPIEEAHAIARVLGANLQALVDGDDAMIREAALDNALRDLESSIDDMDQSVCNFYINQQKLKESANEYKEVADGSLLASNVVQMLELATSYQALNYVDAMRVRRANQSKIASLVEAALNMGSGHGDD